MLTNQCETRYRTGDDEFGTWLNDPLLPRTSPQVLSTGQRSGGLSLLHWNET
jgi:hypothetical protein